MWPKVCSCPASLYSIPAGVKKFVTRDMLLPRKPLFKSGRSERACGQRNTPAPQAPFSIRQGGKSFWPEEYSCPASLYSNSAGVKKFVARDMLLPRKPLFKFGRSERACGQRNTPAPLALFSIRQGGKTPSPEQTLRRNILSPEFGCLSPLKTP